MRERKLGADKKVKRWHGKRSKGRFKFGEREIVAVYSGGNGRDVGLTEGREDLRK